MMERLIVAACCALALSPSVLAADVYKWKDAGGKTVYSDSPPLTNVPYVKLSGKTTLEPVRAMPAAGDARPASAEAGVAAEDAEEAAKAGAQPKAQDAPAGAEAGKPTPDPAAQKKAQEDKAAKEAEAKRLAEEKLAAEKKAKEEACKNARIRVAQFQQGGRIYNLNEKGEREYLGDKEISVGLEQAQADVAENCE